MQRATPPKKRGSVYVGTSGWCYAHWRGRFFPKGLKQKDEFSYLAERVSSLEVNGTFYGLLHPTNFAAWATKVAEVEKGTPLATAACVLASATDIPTPKNINDTVLEANPGPSTSDAPPLCIPDTPLFQIAVKGSRFITHSKRLTDGKRPGSLRTSIANFFAQGVLLLGDRLGPVLWQLPPKATFDAARLKAFLALLPKTQGEAAALVFQHHDPSVFRGSKKAAYVPTYHSEGKAPEEVLNLAQAAKEQSVSKAEQEGIWSGEDEGEKTEAKAEDESPRYASAGEKSGQAAGQEAEERKRPSEGGELTEPSFQGGPLAPDFGRGPAAPDVDTSTTTDPLGVAGEAPHLDTRGAVWRRSKRARTVQIEGDRVESTDKDQVHGTGNREGMGEGQARGTGTGSGGKVTSSRGEATSSRVQFTGSRGGRRPSSPEPLAAAGAPASSPLPSDSPKPCSGSGSDGAGEERQHDESAAAGVELDQVQVLPADWANLGLRYAIEVRHASFNCEECFRILREHNVALVVADTGGLYPYLEVITADFVYMRLHGREKLYQGSYSKPQDQAATMCKLLHMPLFGDGVACNTASTHLGGQGSESEGKQALSGDPSSCANERDVYLFYDNDEAGYAAHNATEMLQLLRAASHSAHI